MAFQSDRLQLVVSVGRLFLSSFFIFRSHYQNGSHPINIVRCKFALHEKHYKTWNRMYFIYQREEKKKTL